MSFKDWWKEKYFLSKGEIIGGLIGLILGLIILINAIIHINKSQIYCFKAPCPGPSMLLYYFGMIFLILTGIILGALVGWIIGKIKSKQ